MVARAKVTAAVALACKVARSRFVSDAPDEIARRCAAADEPDIAAIAAEVLAVEVDRYAADMDQAAK